MLSKQKSIHLWKGSVGARPLEGVKPPFFPLEMAVLRACVGGEEVNKRSSNDIPRGKNSILCDPKEA